MLDARAQVHTWADFLGALESKCLTLVPWCETTWSEEMVKLRTGPFGPLVEEAFVKHGITQVTTAAQITEEKWKQARVPLQRALWLRRASSEVSRRLTMGDVRDRTCDKGTVNREAG